MLSPPVFRPVAGSHLSGRHQQPVVNVQRHSTGVASRLSALLLGRILPVCSLVVPCQTGASPVSVPCWTFTTDC